MELSVLDSIAEKIKFLFHGQQAGNFFISGLNFCV